MGGCCSSPPPNVGDSVARADPDVRDVALQDDASTRVGLASASLAYSLLVADNDGAVFLDVRGRAAFDKGHLFGAWCIDVAGLKAGAGAEKARPASPKSEDKEAGPEAALRTRCTLRSVVVCGDQPAALRDEAVLDALRLLQQVKARPKGQPMVLRGGVPAFAKRYGFCMRRRGGETSQPLPPSPAEILPLGPGKAVGSLFVGVDRCAQDAGTEKVLESLGIKTVLSLGAQAPTPSRKGCRLIRVQAPADDAVGMALAAHEKRLVWQAPPCLVCGPASALVVALAATEALPSVLRSVEEVDAYVKLRVPWAEFDSAAHAAIARALAKARGDRELPPLDPAMVEPVIEGSASPTSPAEGGGAPTFVEELCTKFQRRDRRKAEASLNTVRAALTHVIEQPTEQKYRRLKGSNDRVKREVLAHEEAVKLLRASGWIADGDDLILPPTAPLQGLRDVLAHMPAGTKSTATK